MVAVGGANVVFWMHPQASEKGGRQVAVLTKERVEKHENTLGIFQHKPVETRYAQTFAQHSFPGGTCT